MLNDDHLERERVVEILQTFSNERENLIPVLQKIQVKLGYLPREAIEEVADFIDIPESQVYGVATFYNQFRFIPPGKHPVKVCMGTACHIRGGKIVLDCWERRLGIKEGEVTADREFSIDRVACVGCCTLAPVMLVDEAVYGKVMPTKIDGILMGFELEKEEAGVTKEDESLKE